MSARKFVNSITILGTAPGGRVSAIAGDFVGVGDLNATGTPSSTTYLRGDGTWSTPGGGSGTVTSVNLTAPAAGITVSGGPITTSGSITLALADDLAALEALTGTNTIYYRSAANTWTAVTIGSGLSFTGGTLSATGGGGTVTSVSGTTNQVAVATGTTTPVISLTGPHNFTSQTAHGVLLGNGTGAVVATAAMTDGQLLVGQTGADPLPKTISGDATLSAAGAVTLTIGANRGLRGHIDGCWLHIPGGSGTAVLEVEPGTARDSTDAYTLSVAAGTTFAKTLGGAWTAGNGSTVGGLDTGASAANTWYHVWLIAKADGSSTDVLFSLSATAPTMPATYTLKRRIGAGLADASKNWTAFNQYGDEFLWSTGVQDVNTTVGTTATLYTLSVPPGVQVWAQIASVFTGNKVLLSSPDQSDEAPSGTVWTDQAAAGPGTPSFIRTNTSGQIRGRGSAAGLSIQLRTIGWRDPRGRDA